MQVERRASHCRETQKHESGIMDSPKIAERFSAHNF